MKTACLPRRLRIFRFILVFLFVLPLHAQQELFVSGRVLDSLSHKPLESCAVGFYNDKNQVVNGAVTDAKGYFELSLPPGRYRMVLDFSAMRKRKSPCLFAKTINSWEPSCCRFPPPNSPKWKSKPKPLPSRWIRKCLQSPKK
ncbi:MAG: carboxypeptidase-like regulatory domain-containing protein [Chlorobi bacterium]|nr:carboxypeptidase-like regulatory domain-containing protein [Chlorobiota bacterium]